MSTTAERLRALVGIAAQDAVFAALALPDEPRKALHALEKKRSSAYEAAARGAPAVDASQLDLWLAVCTRALVAHAAPWFVPMRAAIDEGLSMERVGHGIFARLAGHAPLERVARIGAFAVRVARAVSAADGPPTSDEQRAIDLLLAALALPDDEARVLRAEPPMPIEAIDVPQEMELDLARAVVFGAWDVAAQDGLDPAELSTLESLARRLAIHKESMEEGRKNAERATQTQRALGSAAIDAIRYVAALLEPATVRAIVDAAIPLAMPNAFRLDTARLVASGGSTPLGKAHEDLDRHARGTVLVAAWAVAASVDPSTSMRARLAARHDRVAIDLGAEKSAAEARALVDDHVNRVLDRGVAAAGG